MIINILVIGFILFSLTSILFKQNGIENLFKWIILGFVLGYRTFTLVPGLKFHPIEIFIYAGIIRMILPGLIKYRKMPIGVSILSIFMITFLFIGILTWHDSDILLEFKNAFLLTLVFYITRYIRFDKTYIMQLLKYYLLSASIISILGITEYLFPSFMSSIFGFQIKSNYITEGILYRRLNFLFWGSSLAANLIAPVFPILLLLKAEKDPTIINNYFLTLLIFINLFAIYLSGNRISWLILTILLISTIVQYRTSLIPYMKTYAILVTVFFVAYIYSQPVEGRYFSTFKALAGKIDTRYDSSGGERLVRISIAVKSIINRPLGTGWGTQGWVHSDVLQIGATIGIIPGLIIFLGPLSLLIKLYKSYLLASSNDKTVFFTLCGLLIYVMISLIFNGNIVKVQTGVPLFVLWAVADASLGNTNRIRTNWSSSN